MNQPSNQTSIILASQSPRRRQLLEWAEVPFEVIVKETDESYPGGLSMDAIAMHIARNKALAVKEMILHSNDENKLNRTILAAAEDRCAERPEPNGSAIVSSPRAQHCNSSNFHV